MNFSVVILNWNAADDTARCIRRVLAWDSYAQLKSRIWVVDNASDPPGIETLRPEFSDVTFLLSPSNRGFAGGCNMGIAAALDTANDAILLMNNDASMNAGSMTSLLETLRSNPSVGVVGPSLYRGDRLLSVGGRDIAHYGATHIKSMNPPDKILDVDYVSGTVALIAPVVFQKVGLLDEDYFFAGEMADFCKRAWQGGFRCVTAPKARADHDTERSSDIRKTLYIYYVYRNRFLFIRKHYPRNRVRLSALWTLRGAYAVLKSVAKTRRRQARAICLGVIDGWSGRFGGQNDRVLG